MSLTLNLGKASVASGSFKKNSAVVIGSSTYSVSASVGSSELSLGNIGKLKLSDSGDKSIPASQHACHTAQPNASQGSDSRSTQ